MNVSGQAAWVFPDNFDVDHIIGIPNIGLRDIGAIAACLMAELDPGFRQRVSPGDILVAGRNFGYGHAHPQPMEGMRHLGICTVVAESYTFPFYRSELASGMKLFVCPDIARKTARGDRLAINADAGRISNLTSGAVLPMEPLSAYPRRIMELGGIVPFIRELRKTTAGIPGVGGGAEG